MGNWSRLRQREGGWSCRRQRRRPPQPAAPAVRPSASTRPAAGASRLLLTLAARCQPKPAPGAAAAARRVRLLLFALRRAAPAAAGQQSRRRRHQPAAASGAPTAAPSRRAAPPRLATPLPPQPGARAQQGEEGRQEEGRGPLQQEGLVRCEGALHVCGPQRRQDPGHAHAGHQGAPACGTRQARAPTRPHGAGEACFSCLRTSASGVGISQKEQRPSRQLLAKPRRSGAWAAC